MIHFYEIVASPIAAACSIVGARPFPHCAAYGRTPHADEKGALCERFDALIERLSKDRKIKTEEMRAVAKLFLGYELDKKKGRAAALAEIVSRQEVAARQSARSSALDRLKPW